MERSNKLKITPRQGDIGLGIAAIVVGIVIVLLTKVQALSFIQRGMPGPGMFPMICGVAISVCGGIIIFETHRKKIHKVEQSEETKPTEKNILKLSELKSLAIFSVSGILIIVLSKYLGIITGLALLVFGYILIVGRESWWKSGLISIGTALFLYYVFVVFLRVPLPKGPFGF